jgi:hypothetical protein
MAVNARVVSGVTLEELDLTLVLLGRVQRLEGAEVATPAGSQVALDGKRRYSPDLSFLIIRSSWRTHGSFILAKAPGARYRGRSVPNVGAFRTRVGPCPRVAFSSAAQMRSPGERVKTSDKGVRDAYSRKRPRPIAD